jgi:hypothetical protein
MQHDRLQTWVCKWSAQRVSSVVAIDTVVLVYAACLIVVRVKHENNDWLFGNATCYPFVM